MGNQNSVEDPSSLTEEAPATSPAAGEAPMGALTRPTRGPTGLRPEARQRTLPKAARPDLYDIPESPEKIKRPKLRQPSAAVPEFSPTRKQRHAAASASRTNQDLQSDQTAVENLGTTTLEVEPGMTSPRRSIRAQAHANMRPAEESVGSAKRHASPVVRPPHVLEKDDESGALFVSLEHGDAAAESHESPAMQRKRGRPRKEDGKNVSKKRARTSTQAADESGSVVGTNYPVGHDPGSFQDQPARSTHVSGSSKESRMSSTDQGAVHVKPTKIRPSELFSREPQSAEDEQNEDDASSDYPDENEEHVEEEEEEEEQEAPAITSKQKAARTLKAKQAQGKKPKPRKPATVPKTYVADVELSEISENDIQDDGNSLGGQYIVIKKMRKVAVPLVEAIGDGEDLDDTVDKLRSSCRSFRKSLNKLRESKDAGLLSQLPKDLKTVHSDVEMLCGENVDRDNLVLSRSIYFCLFPALIRVLRTLVRCYIALDIEEDTDGISVTIAHLKDIKRFVGLITRLGNKATSYVKPDMKPSVVRPVKSRILAPLAEVERSLSRQILEHQERQQEMAQARRAEARAAAELADAQAQAERAAEEAEAQEQAREAAELAEAHAQAEKARWQKLEKKWDDLHEERKRCECGGIMTLAKRKHLLQPRARPEQDQMGATFRRVEVFHPRIGPPPATVERIKAQIWPASSQQALVAGLRKWAGDVFVFERIFRAYCWTHEPLNPYNVSEIVVQAAELKKALERTEDVESEEWAWVACIPDWTKAESLLQQLEASELEL